MEKGDITMRGYLLSLWNFFDPIYFKLTRLQYLTNTTSKEKNIFRVRLTRYKGKNLTLNDGTVIKKNDLLVKIHLHNIRLLMELKNVKNEMKKAIILYHHVKKSLPGIEQFISQQSHSYEIKGIVGITLINKGCERLGFEKHHISHPIYKVFKATSSLSIAYLVGSKASIKNQLIPSYLFMSRKTLLDKYSTTKGC